jgi:predicted dehydrogenase
MSYRPRIGVIGCGYWGKNHVRTFSRLNALAMVCDPDPSTETIAREIASGVPFTTDVNDILHSDVDGVVIASPAETHADLCQKALQAGKDVLCEKPLALRLDDAKRSAYLAAEHNRILMTGHLLEYHPGVVKLRELIESGVLGKVQYIYSNRLSLGIIRREENILWSFAPHDISLILRFVGDMPFQVICSGGAYLQPNIADMTVMQMVFATGIAAHIFVSWLHPFKEQRLVVVGSERIAAFNDVAKELIVWDLKLRRDGRQTVPEKADGQKVPFPPTEPLLCECQAFLDAIRSRQQPLTGPESAINVLRILHAAQRSLITHGQPVMLPLE